jgi:pimeloyl-ACP methyl ester carboxylesterase
MTAESAPPAGDEELLSEMRQLAISIQKNPSQKLRIVADWYEQTLRTSGPQRAELGLLLLTILNARESGHAATIEAVVERPLVISLHGIRTRGTWQKQLSSALSREGFIYEPMDYGFFRAIQLVLPFMRERKMKWFLDQYNALTKGYRNPPSIIAHSFGTYLVARTLQKYAEVRFGYVIFCGSIVEVAYPWTRIADSSQVARVLNDYGGKDFWARTAVFFVNDAGPSGAKGFQDCATGRVINRHRPEFRHSDFFYQSNYERTWIPFLSGTDPTHLIPAERRKPNWKFRIVVALSAIISVLVLAYFLYPLAK